MRLYPDTIEQFLVDLATARQSDDGPEDPVRIVMTTRLAEDICLRIQAAESRRRFPRVPIRH